MRNYAAAVRDKPFERGSHEARYDQAKLLLAAMDATDEQKAKIAAAFPDVALASRLAHE